MDKFVPIIYLGPKPEWRDPLTKLVFKKDEITLVPGWAYQKILSRPEFKDARTKKMKERPVDMTPPRREEEDWEPPLMDLNAMTKENITQYAKRNFNLELRDDMRKEEMVDRVRRQMGTSMPVGYF